MNQYYEKLSLKTKFEVPQQVHAVLKGHKGCIYQVKFNKNGEYCMSCSQDRSIILWNPNKGTLIKQFSGLHNYEILDVAIGEDNSKFCSVGGDKSAFLWDVKSDKLLRKFEGHTNRINTVSFNDDESVVITGSFDTTIRFWDLKSNTYKPLDIFKDAQDSVSKVVINKYEVLASSIDGKVRTYDLRMGLVTNDDMKHPVLSFSLSNDKKTYAASCMDGGIRLVDREKGEILNTYSGHQVKDITIGVMHSFDDAYLITGSEDGSVYYYDLLQSKPINQFKNHVRTVSAVDLSPQRNFILSGSLDNTITVWK
ncbi:MAP kinase organizer 1 (macronuclear) [Tetrahymena thermophila SB210]|uniref:MAP kinase organizer 1 n=1 Tax=Tetrahymena thermophila (strain SB210) TaxID=312017 RepID=I7M9A6_TETTS|nr:MAP kinase organizer 1 [Tetrahymena thermophila SB210]EAS01217.1 MAP kinase organizer 1 [Tetrahymena thermophila SB210]|eukprot:XP_001021462.1 MAP kinase organizer 1 [Tetrahymena thermophila SB210]